jgi:Na+-translocating ferredoxin:NAD+ oxidoreductase RnfD subunit
VLAVITRRKRLFPDGAILTGLIVGLVLESAVSWQHAAATAAIAVASKHVLKVRKKPIFNPAAFGLLAAILLFGTGQSWWGGLAEMPTWCVAFLVIGGYLVTARVNKFPQAFAFLGVHYLLWLGLGVMNVAGVGDLFRTPFINSALFLAFFMVTDPPTSPGKYKSQVVFGTLAAVASVADYLWLHDLGYLLTGLLVANVYNAIRVLRKA